MALDVGRNYLACSRSVTIQFQGAHLVGRVSLPFGNSWCYPWLVYRCLWNCEEGWCRDSNTWNILLLGHLLQEFPLRLSKKNYVSLNGISLIPSILRREHKRQRPLGAKRHLEIVTMSLGGGFSDSDNPPRIEEAWVLELNETIHCIQIYIYRALPLGRLDSLAFWCFILFQSSFFWHRIMAFLAIHYLHSTLSEAANYLITDIP